MAVLISIAALAAVALATAIGAGFFRPRAKAQTAPIEDAATPYVAALRAACRIERARWIAEQRVYGATTRYTTPELPRTRPETRHHARRSQAD
ncbi:MAG TPA: hypothetical protein VIH71_18335 [Solirubrobacteraceae bacterium]